MPRGRPKGSKDKVPRKRRGSVEEVEVKAEEVEVEEVEKEEGEEEVEK